MLEAVARGKAHWLFNAESEKSFSGKRRPQEDMVTSAVFGSIWQMSPEDRYGAIEILLGRDAFKATGFTPDDDIEVNFWPRLAGPPGRRLVEPDILLKSAGRTAVIEVKWHAPLSESQLQQQVEAVGYENTTAVVMLGEAGVEEEICGVRAFRRTWRDVSAELQKANAPASLTTVAVASDDESLSAKNGYGARICRALCNYRSWRRVLPVQQARTSTMA